MCSKRKYMKSRSPTFPDIPSFPDIPQYSFVPRYSHIFLRFPIFLDIPRYSFVPPFPPFPDIPPFLDIPRFPVALFKDSRFETQILSNFESPMITTAPGWRPGVLYHSNCQGEWGGGGQDASLCPQ